MKKIVILTGNQLRHDYFKMKFSRESEIEVVATYCDIIEPAHRLGNQSENKVMRDHFASRTQCEKDFFAEYIHAVPDHSSSIYIRRGAINEEKYIKEIRDINPDLIITYGCCIVKPPLIDLFPDRIINVHLGLSPYYFGSGTNFHPFANNELAAVGCTFMYLDAGIDTGEIIHQCRALVDASDNIHQVGNRLIQRMTTQFIQLVKGFDKIMPIPFPPHSREGKVYRAKDCTPATIQRAYQNLKEGICKEYVGDLENQINAFPIVEQPFLC